jgi:Tol biopolymer transport system component
MDIWILDVLRKTKTRLTFGSSLQRHPVWSADGKTVFYISNVKGQFDIYAKAADGSGAEQTVLESSDSSDLTESASPDQRYLVYGRQPNDLKTGLDIWALPLFGDRKPFPVVQTEFNKSSSVVSPDGKWLAYQSDPSGRYEIYITAFPGGGAKWQVSTGGGLRPKWRRDGKELFFLEDATFNLLAVDVNTSANTPTLGTPHVLFQTVGVQAGQGAYDVTADGKKFLINSSGVSKDSYPLTIVQNWTAELRK